MVLPDWSAPPKRPRLDIFQETSTTSRPVAMARPADRLAAVVVDIFVVLLPIYVLVSAPFKRWLTTSFILGAESDFFLSVVFMWIVAVSLIVSYQALMHHAFGCTIGKRLFDLRVVNLFSEDKISLWDQVARSYVWVLELMLLGLPWLAVYSNPKRRPWHDRIADTVVVTRSSLGVAPPLGWERSVVRSVFAAIIALGGLVATVYVRSIADKIQLEQSLLAMTEKTEGECEVVTQSLNPDDESQHARLNLAMTLYAAGLADRSCLEAEVDREASLKIPNDAVTYLAQSFIHAEDAEVSNSYLERVCEEAPGAVECAMSKLITAWSEQRWGEVDQLIQQAPRGSGYLEVWGVRHHMKQAQYEQALAALDGLSQRRELSDFIQVQRVKALFNDFRETEAQTAFAQAWLTLPDEDASGLSAWLCGQQLQTSCQALTNMSCRLQRPSEELDVADHFAALSSLLTLECQGKESVDYLSLLDAVSDEHWRMFLRASLKSQMQDTSTASALFLKVLADVEAPDVLKVESVRRLAQIASQRQMETVVALWSALESKEVWVKTGNLLFNRLVEHKHEDLAVQVARPLMSMRALSPKGMTQLATMAETPPTSRAPASARPPVKRLLEDVEGEH